MKKVIFLFLILFIGMVNAGNVSFVAFGHVYPGYDSLEASVDSVNELNPDFIIFLGDSIHSPTESWEELKKIIEKFNSSVYFVPGNHDIGIEKSKFKDGYFLNKMSEELYYSFDIGGQKFVVLNSVTGKSGIYDIGSEQVDFVKGIEGEKIIFMHHCLFRNPESLFCNAREYGQGKNWQEMDKKDVKAVFVGDVSMNEPYFSYTEDRVDYYGVGFSAEEKKLQLPRHFLYVSIEDDKMRVQPFVAELDLVGTEYEKQFDEGFKGKFKEYVRKNLEFLIKFILVVFFIFILIILGLFYLINKLAEKINKNKN